jgi:predicted DNA binding CopG/RHH family protein
VFDKCSTFVHTVLMAYTAKTERTAIRVTVEELEQIDALAAARGLSRSRYVADAALGRLDVEQQVQSIESRLDRLERLAFSE